MPQTRLSKYFPILFLAFDLLCLNVGYLSAVRTVYDGFFVEGQSVFLGALNLAWAFVFVVVGLNKKNRNKGLLSFLNKTLNGLIIYLSLVFAYWFIFQPEIFSRKFLFFTFLIFSVLAPAWRIIWHYVMKYYRKKGYNIRRAVILGSGDLELEIKQFINQNLEYGYVYEGSISSKIDIEEAITDYREKGKIDILFCCISELSEQKIKDVIDICENNLIKINLVSHFSKLKSYNLSIDQIGNTPILQVNPIPLDKILNRAFKRLFDIIFSIFIFIFILSWLIPFVGILIKLESKGPVFFKQKRHGKDNKLFTCWKFRTMTYQKNAEFKQAQKNDNRITKAGAILRKTSIDEIPQFINVFLGSMSVVGPRPHPIKLNEEFQPKIDKFWQRHAVKPGITGLAQARGFRGETAEFSDMSGRVKLDRFYVKNWSMVFDIKIIVLTVLSIVKGDKNAY